MYEEVVKAIIRKAEEIFGRDDVTEETNFKTDLHAKSMNIVQIATMLEDTYDVEVPYMKFRRYETVGEAAGYIAGLIEEE